MQVLISYDISSHTIRKNVFEKLKEYGFNTQRSVFECEVDPKILKELSLFLQKIIEEKDSILIQPLCKRCVQKVQVSGIGLKVINYSFEVI